MVSRLSRGIIHRKNTLFLSLPRMIDTRLHREKGWTLFQKFITTSDMNPIGNEDTSIFVLKFLGKGILLSLHVTWRKIRKSRVSFPSCFFFLSCLESEMLGKNTRHRLLLGDTRMPLSIDYSARVPGNNVICGSWESASCHLTSTRMHFTLDALPSTLRRVYIYVYMYGTWWILSLMTCPIRKDA